MSQQSTRQRERQRRPQRAWLSLHGWLRARARACVRIHAAVAMTELAHLVPAAALQLRWRWRPRKAAPAAAKSLLPWHRVVS